MDGTALLVQRNPASLRPEEMSKNEEVVVIR